MIEKQFMNEPVDWSWTEEDLATEFEGCQDKRKVAKIFCIPVREVTAILKKRELLVDSMISL